MDSNIMNTSSLQTTGISPLELNPAGNQSSLLKTPPTRRKLFIVESPITYCYSPVNSPPCKRKAEISQALELQKALEQKSRMLLKLGLDLETERSENLYCLSELEHYRNTVLKLEREIQKLKEENREKQATEYFNASFNMESELRNRFHQVLEEKRKIEENLSSWEKKFFLLTEEKDALERRCKYLDSELCRTRHEKQSFSVEMTTENMSTKLAASERHNHDLRKSMEDLEELFQQQRSISSTPSSRPTLAPINYLKCDTRNLSLEVIEDILPPLYQVGSPGENMGDVFLPLLYERIEELEEQIEEERKSKLQLERNNELLKMEQAETLLQLERSNQSNLTLDPRVRKGDEETQGLMNKLELHRLKENKIEQNFSGHGSRDPSITSHQGRTFEKKSSHLEVEIENMKLELSELQQKLTEEKNINLQHCRRVDALKAELSTTIIDLKKMEENLLSTEKNILDKESLIINMENTFQSFGKEFDEICKNLKEKEDFGRQLENDIYLLKSKLLQSKKERPVSITNSQESNADMTAVLRQELEDREQLISLLKSRCSLLTVETESLANCLVTLEYEKNLATSHRGTHRDGIEISHNKSVEDCKGKNGKLVEEIILVELFNNGDKGDEEKELPLQPNNLEKLNKKSFPEQKEKLERGEKFSSIQDVFCGNGFKGRKTENIDMAGKEESELPSVNSKSSNYYGFEMGIGGIRFGIDGIGFKISGVEFGIGGINLAVNGIGLGIPRFELNRKRLSAVWKF